MRLKFGAGRSLAASMFAMVVALSPAALSAESLGDALASAYKNSGLLEQNRANLRATDEGVAAAVSAMRPTLGYTASAGYDAVGGGAGAWAKSLEFSASMTLFTFGKNKLSVDAAKETVLATRASLVAIEQDVLGAAISAYMDVRYYEAQANVRANSVRLNQQNLRAAQDRFEVGEITRTEVSQVEAQLASARSLNAAAQGQVLSAREAYKVAVGNYPSNLSTPPSVKVPASTVDEAVRLAVQSHPAIKALQHRISALDLAVQIAERGLLPTVSASASRTYGSDWNDNALTVENSRDSFGIVARGNIYAGGNGASAIRKAQANLDAARAELHTSARQVEQNVRTAWSMLSVTAASSKATAASVQAQRVAYQGVKEEADLGASTTLDVLEAEQDLLDAQVLAIQARINSESAVFSLLSAMGLLTVSHLNLDVPVYDPAAYYNAVKTAPTSNISAQGEKLDRVLQSLGRN
ncbi:outer membrane protein [Pacificibacter maritimus]|uniref:Outer membrane protein n=1 Tax=Pacificibacter maritimus TaxID=762213 RepID=A0A3N4ULR7_9RHOB|nr:TolC family outer membrane protein [Pacificibacter maritimus]RPE70958.1 outer membrane protein [Pacificibacter maritimus]